MEEELDICSRGSRMERDERLLLRIRMRETDDPSGIFPDWASVAVVPPYLQHLELDGFGVSRFLKYRASEHPALTAAQRQFAQRVQDVLLDRLDSSSSYNMYVHDLVEHLLDECRLSDGLDLYARASKLSLHICDRDYTLLSNKEGCDASGSIVWLLQEGFRKFDMRYKNGDVQLASALVAACRANAIGQSRARAEAGAGAGAGAPEPQTLYGLKVLGEEFFVFRADFDPDYIHEIVAGQRPSHDLVVHRYPQHAGLRISKPNDRRRILSCLHLLREQTLSTAPSPRQANKLQGITTHNTPVAEQHLGH
jgi:hypothetical protein